MKHHENYKELIWMLAKTDFKVRYQNSVLGYVWALLQPFLIFSILNFVFSSVFSRGAGQRYYSLQLFVGVILFTFFTEGTTSGMASLLHKSHLVTKIFIPRWTIILSSTINATMIFVMNLVVIIPFFIYKHFVPSFASILMFSVFIILTYIIILSFALLVSPLYIRFRDLLMIWQVITRAMFYATPIIYSLQAMPAYVQRVLLLNPMAFIIHYTKESMIFNHYPEPWQFVLFISLVLLFFGLSLLSFKRLVPKVAEYI